MTYNGWTNYETWVCNLWLDNDGSSEYIADLAVTAMVDHDNDRDGATSYLADSIESMVADAAPNLPNSMFSDMLSAAISEIDFREIAEHYIADLDDQDLD